ncbi:hypothetical protein [Inquilinus sp. OTU3971]|uniref:hypothetical protein n=1 Tax=Inquilinus sp. OTU3971 TaxID=3043855 RepID=UPI00313EAB92
MAPQEIPPLEINGKPPDLAGLTCDGLIRQSYVHKGELDVPAHAIYLLFAGIWHRLYFDYGIIFWRTQQERPEAWSVEEEGWGYPHSDLGAEAGVTGVRLDGYEMEPMPYGSKVIFRFANGRRIVVEDVNDRTSYEVI